MIIEADLDGAELAVLCALSGEPRWQHADTCRMMFGRFEGKHTDEYKFCKSSTFRWCYTPPDKPVSGDPGQLRTYKVSITPATLARFTETMNHAHPNVLAWKRQQIAVLHSRKRVFNPWGRYRNLQWALLTGDPKLREHAENVSLNFPIQTSIGEVMDEAFVRAWDRVDHEVHGLRPGDVRAFWTTDRRANGAWLWGQVHDAFEAVAYDEVRVHQITRIFKESIEQPIPELGGLIIRADVRVRPRWGESDDV